MGMYNKKKSKGERVEEHYDDKGTDDKTLQTVTLRAYCHEIVNYYLHSVNEQ